MFIYITLTLIFLLNLYRSEGRNGLCWPLGTWLEGGGRDARVVVVVVVLFLFAHSWRTVLVGLNLYSRT